MPNIEGQTLRGIDTLVVLIVSSAAALILATATYRGWTRGTRLEVTMVAGGPRFEAWVIDRSH